MGFFRRLVTPSETGQSTALPLGSGRRLRSDLALADCLTSLEMVIRSYPHDQFLAKLTGAHRTAYVVPGWRWNGTPGSAPDTVVSFDDTDGFPLFAVFWPSQRATECALFPLGSGDERLMQMPIIGYWKQQDPSLTSIGLVPQGQFAVMPPRLPDQYLNEILKTAGFPDSPRNVAAIGLKIAELFATRAWELIKSKDPRGAQTFLEKHTYHGGPVQALCQGILDDLAAWRNGAVLPYIQDLPMRCRAFLLERLDDSSFWDDFER